MDGRAFSSTAYVRYVTTGVARMQRYHNDRDVASATLLGWAHSNAAPQIRVTQHITHKENTIVYYGPQFQDAMISRAS